MIIRRIRATGYPFFADLLATKQIPRFIKGVIRIRPDEVEDSMRYWN